MKRHPMRIIAPAIGLAVAVLVACWLIPRHQLSPAHSPSPIQNAAQPTANASSATATAARNEERSLAKEERAKTINTIIEAGNAPINFWGKVVDQDEHPIVDVTINYSYLTEHGNLLGVAWSASKVHKGTATTNGEGLFVIQGLQGSGLSIESLQKEGYQYNPDTARTYDYHGSSAKGKFTPDPSNPILFVMVSKTTTEPLVSYGGNFGKTIRVPGNGTPTRWNLWKGQPDANGELQITFTREPAVLARVGPPATWSAKIEVIGGGISEAQPDEAMHRAPEEGYTSIMDYPKLEQKRGLSARSFYLKTADGKYGRLQLELYPGDQGPTARCLIKVFMNPSGSRNLESVDAANSSAR
jgi:hypothetical protein